MSDELEARIRKTEDFQEITNLQAQYSFLIDTLQLDTLVDLFADDFIWEAGFDEMSGVTSKRELLQRLKGAGEATTMMCHQPVTPYIEVEGDKAKGTWYVFGMLTSVTPNGEVAKWVQGRLDNEYVRVGGRWKISRHRFTYNFHTPYEDGWVKTPNARNWAWTEDAGAS